MIFPVPRDLFLLRRAFGAPRTKPVMHLEAGRRDRALAQLAKHPGPLRPRIATLVHRELKAALTGAGLADDAAESAERFARMVAVRTAYDHEQQVADAIASAKAENLAWAREDALMRASGWALAGAGVALGLGLYWLTRRDDRVCQACEDLDGEVFPAGEPPEYPAHPRCRCKVFLRRL